MLSIYFVHDRLADGRPFRLLTLVDNFSRVSPAIECDFSLNGPRVVAVLERLQENGLPQTIQVDYGSEFISKALDKWAYDNQVTLEYLQKVYQGREIWNTYLRVEPRLDQLRDDPRFHELVRRVESK
jgi:transposase InsO family protein